MLSTLHMAINIKSEGIRGLQQIHSVVGRSIERFEHGKFGDSKETI